MAPKKKKAGKRGAPKGEGKSAEHDAGRESVLHTEYEKLSDSFDNLKQRKEWLILENESLQREVDQTRFESEEYISYQSKRHQRLQSLMASSTEQPSLTDVTRQGEEHQERTTKLTQQLAEQEEALAGLDAELCGLSEFKRVEAELLSRIRALEAELPPLRLRQRDTLRGLEAQLLSERGRCEGSARRAFQAAALATSREVALSQLSVRELTLEENERLIVELQKLIQKARVLRARQGHLQTSRDPLLLDREYATMLMASTPPE